jgi:hypothetical protein
MQNRSAVEELEVTSTMFIPKIEERHHFCFACSNEIDFDRIKMQRTDTCPHCAQDMHCCKNCEYWDESSHNQCREHSSEYITDRERANYCTLFEFKNGPHEANSIGDAKSKLENLFK